MKKVWITIILTLLILTLGAGVWWLYNKPLPTNNVVSAPVANTAPTNDVKLYMIAYGDNGAAGEKFGCDDSAVEVSHTVASEDVLTGTYEDLLSLRDEAYGESGLYNTLARSSLKVESTSVNTSGVADIMLTGKLNLAGVCDGPRIQMQLEKPAMQFPGVKAVNVTINGQPLPETLLLR